ncbi:MAG: HAMP domain-containing histidine kinase [Leptolyngbyaceae cyanobacterium CRU_2_3]|nr:HAMP domain-containing histidine kinase [Leptolyngbyaceae cyanobacterium CRU_2_3]
MLMPASAEFVALCQAQIALLQQGLGSALSIVYLTEEVADATDAKMLPVAAYPEAVATWGEDQIFSLLSGNSRTDSEIRSLQLSPSQTPQLTLLPTYSAHQTDPAYSHPLEAAETALSRQQQVVLPLIHEEVVMGLLVTARADRAWTDSEQSQIEQIAETITLGCVLDQRSQWLAQDARQQRLLREQRRDLLDNLLHQFRNPLTAMRTFGKLLARRIRPEDINRSAAEGIVRESDRLKDLLKQFDAAVDLDEMELSRLLSPSEVTDLHPTASPRLTAQTPPLLTASHSTNLLVGTSIHLEAHAITEVLNPLLESAQAIAQERQLWLRVDIPERLLPVQVDVPALREVLSNVIDNALKYTPAGGQIRVLVQSDPATLPATLASTLEHRVLHWQAIAVIDTGPGIPPQDLKHLFERHYRGVQAATDIPGTGLGLAIARDLLLQMQGEIQVFSPAYTSGILPLPAESPEPESLKQPEIFGTAALGTAVMIYLPEAAANS